MAKKLKKKKDSKKLNPFDVVVVLLILCLVGALGYRVYQGVADPSFQKDSKYVVTFECDEGYNSLVDYLENNEAVYFSANGELFGNLYAEKAGSDLISVITEADADDTEITDTEETEVENSGEESVEDPSSAYEKVKFTGKLKLNSDAVFVSGGNYYAIGEMNFNWGSVIEVYTEDAVFTIKVTGISVIQ